MVEGANPPRRGYPGHRGASVTFRTSWHWSCRTSHASLAARSESLERSAAQRRSAASTDTPSHQAGFRQSVARSHGRSGRLLPAGGTGERRPTPRSRSTGAMPPECYALTSASATKRPFALVSLSLSALLNSPGSTRRLSLSSRAGPRTRFVGDSDRAPRRRTAGPPRCATSHSSGPAPADDCLRGIAITPARRAA